jgi:hypothetical protein
MPDTIDWPGFGRTAKPAVLDRTAAFPSIDGIDLPRECLTRADDLDRPPFSHDDGDGPVLPGLSVGEAHDQSRLRRADMTRTTR